ncbi:Scr1 family TA system antitoxin-like transcriptional regulator [Streptomyces sp. NPDC059063]|uniref:Scr1 family TA system antitoxin-like transcriptional regulator n=1 Tax=unclassified Streptomyces TaxID=2593676 RepID=UPI00369F24AB
MVKLQGAPPGEGARADCFGLRGGQSRGRLRAIAAGSPPCMTPTAGHTPEPWDAYLSRGIGPIQGEFLELTDRTRDSRHYCADIVCGNLQTPGYARAVLRRVIDFHEIPDDIEAGVARRTARAQFIGQGGRTYHTLTITDGSEVAVYEKAFTWLERSAVYGDKARDLIQAELGALEG